MDVRERILAAVGESLRTVGVEHTSVSVVAQRAGVSRPTVYAHFASREAMISVALLQMSEDVCTRVIARSRRARTPADFVVTATVAVAREFATNPVLVALTRPEQGSLPFLQQAVGPFAVGLACEFLAPLREYEGVVIPDLEEVAETVIRFVFSIVLFPSPRTSTDARLRAYLRRRLIPALGLPPRSV